MSSTNIWLFIFLLIVDKNFGEFIHPGLLHTNTDLQRMKDMVAAKKQPWYEAFQSFSADYHSQLNYTIRGPNSVVTREAYFPRINNGTYNLGHDSVAALQLALMYSITGNESYAALSTKILEGWANTLTIINGKLNGIFKLNSCLRFCFQAQMHN